MLGVLADLHLTTTRITLERGDQIVIYTDGLTENSQPRLTTPDLLKLIGDSRADTAADTRAQIMQRYDQLDRRTRYDDVALATIQLRTAKLPSDTAAPLPQPLEAPAMT